MNRKSYQWCVVPNCANTSIATPEKLFIVVPSKANIRRKWLTLAGRSDASQISTNSSIYFCEDHFDIPNDMENYMEYRIMGSVKKIRMKPGCMPRKFDCQKSRKRSLPNASPRSAVKQQRDFIQEAESSQNDIIITVASSHMSDSQHIQEDIKECPLENKDPVLSLQQIESSSLNEEAKFQNQYDLKEVAVKHSIFKIENDPHFYIVLPKECYFLIDLLAKSSNISQEHILLCLKKIRLNTKFTELGYDFGISTSHASKLFLNNIPIIANYLSSFILISDMKTIKDNAPMAFRHFDKVNCIIDCFEIEIQKPSVIHQASTWSEKGNTVKYLISSTPHGLINYISPGYDGRRSDILLVEQSNFLDQLCPGRYVLADCGFKNIEQLLSQRQCHFGSPSVASGSKLNKQEGRKIEEIARMHIERVFTKLREFSMLKRHSVINDNLLRVLDECVIIVCALINLQEHSWSVRNYK